jgi:thiamine biosynthesis lipoprotein
MRLAWSARRFEETRQAMTTFVTVTVEDRSQSTAEEAIGRAFDEMERVVALLTRFESASPLAVLNDTGRLADPPPELRTVIERALWLHHLTGGAFDPTVAPLVDLYQVHFAAHGGPPEAAERREVLELVGAQCVRVNHRTLSLDRVGMALTLDGIGKGFVVDRMTETLAAYGVQHALVNAGGDIRALGPRANGRPWQVGVRHPRQADALVETLDLVDSAVATSGDYVHFHDVERCYHHTIVPSSGLSPSTVASVSVKASSAAQADALATAVFVLGCEGGMRLLARVESIAGLILTRAGVHFASAQWSSQLRARVSAHGD